MDDMDKEMKISFIEEARQLLEEAEQCFLDLENTGGSPEVIEVIFRLAHNMKGTSRAVGFGDVAEFTHELENLLLKLKEGKLSVNEQIANLLLACNDHLKVMVEELSKNLEAKFDSRELIQQILANLDGSTSVPPLTPNELSEVGLADTSYVSSIFDQQDALAQNDQNELNAEPGAERTSDRIDQTSHAATFKPSIEMVEEVPNPLDYVAQYPKEVASRVPQSSASDGDDGKGGSRKQSNASVTDESIRVSLGRLEKLSDFIGELVILQTVLNQHRADIPSLLLQKTVQQLGKLSKEIQDISMSLRMIPLKQTFAKLQRIIRDTSKQLGKEVDLVLSGEATEVDKTVLEQVSDPLVHMVRNAIDHGLEMPDERMAVGKPHEGRIEIRAFHQGNNLVIEIQDDGKGIDPDRLIKKAIEKGIVPAGASLTRQEALHLIFHPGFSTKDQVSEISGRGVGLDVVKTNVERLGGQVQLESEIGQGSIFRIVLPLTLAIIDGMVIQCGNERYVVPISNVHETVQPRREDINFVTGKGEMLNLREQTIPLFRLSSLIRTPGSAKSNEIESHKMIAVIVNSRSSPFAVLVDDIVRQQQVVIKKLGAEIKVQKGLAGSAILGDGKPALILDLNDLLERALSTHGAAAAGGRTAHAV